MHQTFYIDSEEEISSVVDRLNKSMSADNYFVVPKRALFLQSIVNLKLLKREADKVGKHVVIVTQDEIGASMAERAGIDLQTTLEGLDVTAVVPESKKDMRNQIITPIANTSSSVFQDEKKTRLDGIGSREYHDTLSNPTGQRSSAIEKFNLSPRQKTISPNIPLQKNAKFFPTQGKMTQELSRATSQTKKTEQYHQASENFVKARYAKNLDPIKEKNLEKMFSKKDNTSQVQEHEDKKVGSGKTKKIFFSFVFVCVMILFCIAGYLFLPSAKISILPNVIKDKIDIDITAGGSEKKIDQAIIPVRVLEKTESISLSNDVVGTSLGNGKKARGSIVIYNEFNDSPQTLISTTRFESSDGKIFRLEKNVVVPGMTMSGGQSKPGVITADVVADQAGSEYNIAPSDFKIPGFAGSPKYEKFYAKSTSEIVGGSSGEQSAGGAISQGDIDSAKQKTEKALKEKITEIINSEMQPGEMALPQAEKITITKSAALAKIGDMVAEFDYTAVASVQVLIFSENDVRSVLQQQLDGNAKSENNKKEIAKTEYSSVECDFEKKEIILKVHGDVLLTPNIDSQEIKNELLGKTESQLEAILKKYPVIKNINIEFKPSFVSRIPQYSQRVSVEIGNE